MGESPCSQSEFRIFKSTISLGQNDEKIWFLACWYRFMGSRSWLKNIEEGNVKSGFGHSVLKTLKLAVSQGKMYQVDFFASIEAAKNTLFLGLCQKTLLANQFAWFFTFDLFDLLILILGVHWYIVLVALCHFDGNCYPLASFFILWHAKNERKGMSVLIGSFYCNLS